MFGDPLGGNSMCARGREIREREDEERATEKERKKRCLVNSFIAERCLFRDSCQYLKVSPARIDFPREDLSNILPSEYQAGFRVLELQTGDWESQCSVYRLMVPLPSYPLLCLVSPNPDFPLFYLLIH